MTKRWRINLEAIEPKTWNTIEYVNISEELMWFPEIIKSAQDYFKWMSMPRIPDEKWICVYYHDWISFLRKFAWDVQNPVINNI